MAQEKWIILTSTLCQGTIPAWFGDEDGNGIERPVVFNTEKDAYIEMLSEHITVLENQLTDIKEESRAFDEVDWECQDWVEPCVVDENGIITIESGELYNPKTYVR